MGLSMTTAADRARKRNCDELWFCGSHEIQSHQKYGIARKTWLWWRALAHRRREQPIDPLRHQPGRNQA